MCMFIDERREGRVIDRFGNAGGEKKRDRQRELKRIVRTPRLN